MNNTVKSRLSGTKTEQNLRDAIAAESYSHTLYSLYADAARRNGDDVLAEEFERAANNEKEHARLWLEYLGELSEDNMLDNILAAEAGEQYQYEVSYPEFSEIARDEGFDEIAEKFAQAAEVEHSHNLKMKALSQEYSASAQPTIYPEDTKWRCCNCGLQTVGTSAPERCPLCSYPNKSFEIMQ